ncbi:SHOCT domain-containing protein [Chitinivibrio alkaliphilus]|uniref:SHOCT domain-containing protein n=1 Tax=Chitinivibrio alkaliphilus ACht1 TaxID=1313304 RepID=U7DBE8_9BACT|nr:SHOCT domain-containing protein [Chitinivibrio alkaliphilus]ERP31750.1 hypothetical protein CALK_1415 [Chitinivibrio alkaliphilus ACht1]
MASKYCVNCERQVEARRHIGFGTVILLFITSGFWLLTIPFYPLRCPICKGTGFRARPPAKKKDTSAASQPRHTPIQNHDPMEQIKKLQELKEAGAITADECNEKKKKLLDTI